MKAVKMELSSSIIVDYPKNNDIKFLFAAYPAEELSGRDRTVKENFTLPFEDSNERYIVVETDLTDLHESLQTILKEKINAKDSDCIIFRVLKNSKNKILAKENNMDTYNLVYSSSPWGKINKKSDRKLN